MPLSADSEESPAPRGLAARSCGVELRVLNPDDWPAWRAVRLAALAEGPDAFSATLASWQGAGDTAERWRARLVDVPYNVIASVNGHDTGQVSGVAPDPSGRAELISLWVAPAVRGQGVGDALVTAVAAWAKTQGASRLLLDVRSANQPAIALYRRLGFVDCDPGPRPDHDPCEQSMLLRLTD